MKRATIALVLSASALSMAFSNGALAAGTKEKAAATEQSKLSQQWHASTLMDMDVKNAKDEDLGKISELLIDKDGKVSHIVLREGGALGVGGNRYAVPWDRVKVSPDGKVATIDVNKDRLSSEFSAFEEESDDMLRRDDTRSEEDKKY